MSTITGQRRVGIVAGSGPVAGAHLHRLLLAAAQRRGAVQDHEYPAVLLRGIDLGLDPHGRHDPQGAARGLQDEVSALDADRVDVILMACNTLSAHAALLRSSAPVLHLPRLGLAAIERPTVVLCSRQSRESGLFSGPRVLHVSDDEQRLVDDLILAVMGGATPRGELAALVAHVMTRTSAERVLLGCSELSVLSEGGDAVIDPLLLAAEAALHHPRIPHARA